MSEKSPVIIIGAGPVGLAAAAHLYEYNEPFLILEKGSDAGNHILEWEHIQLFSPWEFNIDQASKRLLEQTNWVEPDPSHLPNGKELVDEYLKPLSNTKEIKDHILFNAEVVDVTKKIADKMKSHSRELQPFVLYVKMNKSIRKFEAKAVIDATGTWSNPNPPFADGVWRTEKLKESIHTDIPDVLNEQEKYKNKHIAVIGSGHSALNSLNSLMDLKTKYPKTEISWVVRKQNIEEAFGGEEDDELEARGELGAKTHQFVNQGLAKAYPNFFVEDIDEQNGSFAIQSSNGVIINEVDEIIVNTGARPDFSFLSEVRLGIDPAVQSTPELAPLIDPNFHSCGTVRPHGEKELRHPEQSFYIVGVKSYGRAPTFLMTTGYEQVRSIAAYIAGDTEEATKVKLKLPETGVCQVHSKPKPLEVIGADSQEKCGGMSCDCS
ncbi:Pyridine nucleotide-disulphide oxidoreductase [Salinibacillus kushneri]|uniref:Pyridine nucleotide-disulphide oxidoreductase n=1 Tax=Salinibacillus kushneri TaxID=237682 RepID=A0A1I0IHU4_9BACI|nr:NAD(P)-binding domain-containing protein [Salinibacillus kushneri]SET96451.1 Pyridine nucleotide-disulphide oxidoreductase [Salinibacillus kushneri]